MLCALSAYCYSIILLWYICTQVQCGENRCVWEEISHYWVVDVFVNVVLFASSL
jgi:hypothetical protein